MVDKSRGQELANHYNIRFFETSAKSDINVKDAFYAISKDIKKRLMDSNTKPESGTILPPPLSSLPPSSKNTHLAIYSRRRSNQLGQGWKSGRRMLQIDPLCLFCRLYAMHYILFFKINTYIPVCLCICCVLNSSVSPELLYKVT